MTASVPTEKLRDWARGSFPLEAAIEILVRAHGGRFAAAGNPWIKTDNGRLWLDSDAIDEESMGALSGGEKRLLRIVASLAGGTPVSLGDNLPGLDRAALELVVAAVAHAAGSHEQSEPRFNDDHTAVAGFDRLRPLAEWPAHPRT